jgi:hypothetical protein
MHVLEKRDRGKAWEREQGNENRRQQEAYAQQHVAEDVAPSQVVWIALDVPGPSDGQGSQPE